jgi:hypothetical protein
MIVERILLITVGILCISFWAYGMFTILERKRKLENDLKKMIEEQAKSEK